MTTNPFAPPKSVVEDVTQPQDLPALWNPNAAANLSLIFTPAFGAFLHMKNWQALGEPAKATVAKVWAIGTLVFLVGITILGSSLPIPRSFGIVPLLAWYFSSGREQIKYVEARCGRNYPRRGWGKPILVALAAIFALFAIVFVFVFLHTILTGRV